MKLRKVISGGQTGADRTGLECAKTLGLETGGTAPKGWRIDGGTDPSLADFGLLQSHSESYPPRTEQNVKDSDATVWFGRMTSPGFWCTKRATLKHGKPIIYNPTDLRDIANTYEVINVAGNRQRTNPGVVKQVEHAFDTLRVTP